MAAGTALGAAHTIDGTLTVVSHSRPAQGLPVSGAEPARPRVNAANHTPQQSGGIWFAHKPKLPQQHSRPLQAAEHTLDAPPVHCSAFLHVEMLDRAEKMWDFLNASLPHVPGTHDAHSQKTAMANTLRGEESMPMETGGQGAAEADHNAPEVQQAKCQHTQQVPAQAGAGAHISRLIKREVCQRRGIGDSTQRTSSVYAG